MSEIPKQLRNLRFCRISKGTKIPFEKDWVNKNYSFEEIQKFFPQENYGVICGFGDLAVIDCDKVVLSLNVRKVFPETFSVKTGGGGTHFYFYVPELKKKIILESDGEHLGEIQSYGTQVVGAGSLHPNNNVYEIINNVGIKTISLDEIRKYLGSFMKKEEEKTTSKETGELTKEIASSVDFDELLLGYGLEKKGNNWNCPFHKSIGGMCLSVDRKKGIFNCFHCGWKGNIISFVSKIEDKTIKESIEKLRPKKDIPEEPKEKPEIVHSKDGKLISVVAAELVDILKKEKTLFYRPDSREIVEVGKIKDKNGVSTFTGFYSEKPNRFITQIEQYCVPVLEVYSPKLKCMISLPKSISSELANTILCSEILQMGLPTIKRIFTTPIPIIYEGSLTFPNKGYDERFESWMPFDAPEITKTNMTLEEAKKILEEIFEDFCFETPKDKVVAITALLTPFLRGLYSRFSSRTPVMIYLGNRERAGKDFCAGITGIVYEGYAFEEPPISTSENAKSNNTDEFRKKILAHLIYGRKRFHSSNNKGYINNATFENVTTAEKYSDRVLGRSENLTFDNELEFSLSGNTGITFTPDLANRSKSIKLFLDLEDANSRIFKKPDLHGWVKENRNKILSALFALVRTWYEKGMESGKIPFSSFPEWARVAGGILQAVEYENICGSDISSMTLGLDSETTDMKSLFELAYEHYPEEWISKNTLKELLSGQDIFSYLNLSEKSDQTNFGKKLNRYVGRVLSEIRLIVKDNSVRSPRQELMFTKKSGNVGNVGNIWTTPKPLIKSSSSYSETLPKLPTLPKRDNILSTFVSKQPKPSEEELTPEEFDEKYKLEDLEVLEDD